jgi:4-amino-4-deoxy-L-arabinose transferase-like glycosyltransferase
MLMQISKMLLNKTFQLTVLVFVLFAGISVRMYGIDNPIADWHSFRQADTASVARLYVKNGTNLLIPKYHDISTIQSGLFNPAGYRFVEFPIYNALIAQFYRLSPFIGLEVWARFITIFLAIISGILIYLIGKRFANSWTGILSVVFYMLIPFNIYFTRVILPDPMSVTLGLMGMVFFIYAEDAKNNKLLLLSAFIFCLAILVKPFIIFYFTPLIYFLFSKYNPRSVKDYFILSRHFMLFAIIVILPFVLWRFWESKYPEGIPFYNWIFNGDGIRFKPSFWRWLFGERLSYLILGSWGLIPFAFGLIKKTKNYFFHYFLLGMFFYISIVATANVRHDYYQTFVIPAISLITAVGTLSLVKKGKMGIFIAIFTFFIMSMVGLTNIREYYKIDHPEIIDAGLAVRNLIPENALIIAPYNGDTAFLYQTQRIGWPYVDRPISEMISEGAQYYVSVNYDTQTNEFISKFPAIKKTNEYIILKLK